LPIAGNTLPSTDVDKLSESPFARSVMIPPITGNCIRTLDSGPTNPLPSLAAGYATNHVTEAYQNTAVTSSPTYEAFWGILISNVDAIAYSVELRYWLTYDIVLTGRSNIYSL
jgi:hypothetical protein